MKRQTANFCVVVTIIYAFAFWVMSTRGASITNDYSYTGPGLQNLNITIPGPLEWMSDSGWQAITNAKTAFRAWATNDHNLDGTHKTGFLTSSMIPAGAVTRNHFESNVTSQLVASNGYSQLPLSDVYVQWAWSSNSYNTSSIFSVSWPTPFTNDCWGAICGVRMYDTNFGNQMYQFSSNEFALARIINQSKTGVWIRLHVSGQWTTQYQHRVCVMGIGR